MNKAITLIEDTFSHWNKSNASRMGAAISFYTLFSIAPLFVLLIGLVRTIFDRNTVNGVVAHALRATVGSNLAGSIQALINSNYRTGPVGPITAIVGGVVLIIAAISVFAELNSDLDQLWQIPSTKKSRDDSTIKVILNYLRNRLIAFSVILICGLLLLLSIAFSVLISFVPGLTPLLSQNHLVVQIINILLSLLFSTTLFAIIYRILPDPDLPWKELFRGAFITALLFLVGKFLIAWYIADYSSASVFGTAGSIVGLLLWVYYSAQVFFIGASFTFVYSQKYGFLSQKK